MQRPATVARQLGAALLGGLVTVLALVACEEQPAVPDRAPSFRAQSVANQTYTTGTAIDHLRLPEATGGDGPLAYSLAPDVPGLTFVPVARLLIGTPTEAGTYAMTYRAVDADANTGASDAATLAFTITVVPPAAGGGYTPPTVGPAPAPASCDDSAIRLLNRDARIHGAIVSDMLHMGGATAPATCMEPANQSLEAGLSVPDDRTAQVRQSQYYLIVIRYPGGNRLYVLRRLADGTSCVVDTNDECVAQVSDLPDDFYLEDLPDDMSPTLPAGRPAPPTGSPAPAPRSPGAASSPQPRDGATGVTVGGPLLTWAAAWRARSYDVYWGVATTDLDTPINTSFTALRIAASADLAPGTLYYWRVDAKNEAGTTRGNVWSFTTGAVPPPGRQLYPSGAGAP